MKIAIITLAVALFLSIGNSFGSNTIYKNVEGSKDAGSITTTVYNSSDAKNLEPLKQTVFKYNSDKSLKERNSYKWNSNSKEWVAIGRYKYEYNINGELINVSYTSWNELSKSWNNDVQYAMYIYDENNVYSPVKYLSVTDNRNKKY